MFDHSEIEIKHIITHHVGNKLNNDGTHLSAKETEVKTEAIPVLLKYFLSSFKTEEFFKFYHNVKLSFNEVYNVVTDIFADTAFTDNARSLATLLYDASMHPKIKGGELHVVHFGSVRIEGQLTDAVGLFKSESKDEFLQFNSAGDRYNINSEEGVAYNALDKGCIIFNIEAENGYRIAIVDNIHKGSEAKYWRDDFLKIITCNDSYHATKDYLDICKNYVTDQLAEEYEVDKTDKIAYLNKSVEYFKNNNTFDEQEFLGQVFTDSGVIDSFKKYKEDFVAQHDLEIDDSFEISGSAVKKQSRHFKSILKLDKNFHVYIHGDTSLIEKGYDAAVGKNYYKIYYDQEA